MGVFFACHRNHRNVIYFRAQSFEGSLLQDDASFSGEEIAWNFFWGDNESLVSRCF
jgi:hypothetical protein